MAQSNFPSNLVDKNGQRIYEDDVIYDGKGYYRIYWNERFSQVEAISPTKGYMHNLSQDDSKDFERIGTFKECEHIILPDKTL